MTAFIAGDPYEEGNTAHLLAAGEALGRYHRLARTLSGPSYASAPILEPRAISALDRAEHLVAPFLSAAERRHLRTRLLICGASSRAFREPSQKVILR